jgi:PAS domain S-box-containing protein
VQEFTHTSTFPNTATPTRDKTDTSRALAYRLIVDPGVSKTLTDEANIIENTPGDEQRQRVKELSCLYGIEKLIELGADIDKILKGVISLIPSAWHHVDIACVRIVYAGQKFEPANFKETLWRQSADIKILGKVVGAVEVYHLEEKPEGHEDPFLKEERNLINTVAGRLSRFLERKQLEKTLSETEELLEKVFSSIDIMIAYMDKDFNFIHVNRAYAEANRREPEFFVGKNHFDLYPSKENKEIFRKAVETAEPYFTYAKPFKNPLRPEREITYWDWSLQPVKESDGRVSGLILSLIDVTERQQAQAQLELYHKHLEELMEERTRDLKHSEARYRGIVEDLTEMICRLSPDGKLTFVNDAYCLYFGKRREELVGYSFIPLIHQEDRERVEKQIASLRPERPLVELEERVIMPSGEIRWQEWTNRAIFDDQMRLIEIQSVGRDITERKNLAEIKDRFISAVTHELRTPLVSIGGYLDYILMGKMGAVPEKVRESLKIVKRNADMLLRLTNDLLEIQRIKSGKFSLKLETLDLRKVIELCVEEIHIPIKKKNQNFHLKIPEGSMPVKGDWERLSQALMNLLYNANKFTPEGGDIALQVEEGEVTFKIQVSDTGLGIRKENLETVFEPFADIEKPEYFRGTGLGLSVTRGLIEAHGGRIWADSEGEGKGSTFSFELPKLIGGG